MDYHHLSNEQLTQEIALIRTQLNEIQFKLERGDAGVEYNEMRAKMSRFNLLKLEARKRKLDIGQIG